MGQKSPNVRGYSGPVLKLALLSSVCGYFSKPLTSKRGYLPSGTKLGL